MERGLVTKSQEGKMAYVERKVGECSSGRHMDKVPKETHVVSVMTDKYKETCTVVRDGKDDRLLPQITCAITMTALMHLHGSSHTEKRHLLYTCAPDITKCLSW